MPANLENSAVATGLEKCLFSFQSQRKTMPKNAQTKIATALISHTSKVMLKILHARLQQYMNRELQIFKLDLEKAEEPEIKLSTSIGSQKKQENSRKTSISALSTMPKSLGRSQETVENSSRDGNTRPPDLFPEKSVCRSRSNS